MRLQWKLRQFKERFANFAALPTRSAIVALLFVVIFVLLAERFITPQHGINLLDVLFERESETVPVRTPRPAWKKYPKRVNMEKCRPIHGKIKVFIGAAIESFKTYYRVAHSSLQCYLKSTDYELLLIDIHKDARVLENCAHHKDIMFRRHCALLQYLNETDWMLVIDADTAVVNPEHCIEEYIDPRVDIIFYERFWNFEITAGIFLVRNSNYSRSFLQDWANWEFRRPPLPFGTNDNCCLNMVVLEHVLNDTAPGSVDMCTRIWRRTNDYNSYLAFPLCVKMVLGANRFYPGKLKVEMRATGIAQDGHMTDYKFCDNDFMHHGIKAQDIVNWPSPFAKIPNVSECGAGLSGWYWSEDARIPADEVRRMLLDYERTVGEGLSNVSRVIPWTVASELESCFPNCFFA